MDNEINEANLDNLKSKVDNIFRQLKRYNSKDYLEIMAQIEYSKSKYFEVSNKPKKSFIEYIKAIKT
jgi:hypothetical protein